MAARETRAGKGQQDTINLLLDRKHFVLSEEAFERFTAILDEPPRSNPKLRRLLETEAPWEPDRT